MTSQVDIANRSLLSIGARAQVSSINPSDGSTPADACAVLFTPTFESLARAAHWNCLRKQAVLSLLAAAIGTPENVSGTSLPLPPTPWLYAYQYPSDCLQMRSIVPSFPANTGNQPLTTFNNAAQSYIPGGGQIPYAVAYSTDANNNPIITILTNQTQAQAIYTVNQPNPIIWDSLFQQAMVRSLAAFLVPALTLNMALMGAAVKEANDMIMQARTSDGNEGVTVMDHLPDFIRARGYNPGLIPCNGGYGQFSQMAWPGWGF